MFSTLSLALTTVPVMEEAHSKYLFNEQMNEYTNYMDDFMYKGIHNRIIYYRHKLNTTYMLSTGLAQFVNLFGISDLSSCEKLKHC